MVTSAERHGVRGVCMNRSWIVALLSFAAALAVAAAVVVWVQTRDDPPTASTPSPSTPSASITQSSASPTTTSTTTADTGLLTEPPPFSDVPLGLEYFSSPTGNIGCFLSVDQVHCEIAEYNFELPPEPPSCEFDWVAAFEVGTDADPEPTVGGCQSDTVLGAEDVLPYGTATAVESFACLSQQTGMTCWNQITQRGFTIARAGYVLF
jgi:hypothetical protein